MIHTDDGDDPIERLSRWRPAGEGRHVPAVAGDPLESGMRRRIGGDRRKARLLGLPDLMEHFGLIELTYLGLVVLMISIVGLLGHYGGKLVFHWKDKAS